MSRRDSVVGTLRDNGRLARLVASYFFFILTEYAAWIAVLVFAYEQGGPTEAGLVALAQLVPAALLAPLLSAIADRGSPVRLLIGGYLTQAAGMAAAAGAASVGAPLLVYAAAIVASTAVVTIRPAQASLLPGLSASPRDLTAANVALGWMESAGAVVAGLVAGILLAASGPGLVLAVMAALVLTAACLVFPLRVHRVPAPPSSDARPLAVGEGLRLLADHRGPRLLVALLTAQWIIVGALDVLFVVLALDVLDKGQGWAGYLQMAVGIGGLVAGAVTARLVGRRLGSPILLSAVALSGALALTALEPGAAVTAVLLSAVGAGRAVLDVAGRTLLQRAVPMHLLGRIFGLLEGFSMAGLAIGSLLVPVLVGLGGASVALLGVAAVLPISAVLGGRALLTLDATATVPVVEIALLRSMRLFSDLPSPALEGLAQALERQEVPTGAVLIREGDAGDHYYAIASGEVQVLRGDKVLNRLGRGEGVGEIALLRAIPRTATVTAATATTVYRLGREPFLEAVTGHPASRATVYAVVDERLRDGESGDL